MLGVAGVVGIPSPVTKSANTMQMASANHTRRIVSSDETSDPLRALVSRRGIDSLIAGILPIRIAVPNANGKDSTFAEIGDLQYAKRISEQEGLLVAILYKPSGKQRRRVLKPSDATADLSTLARNALTANTTEPWTVAALVRVSWRNAHIQLLTANQDAALLSNAASTQDAMRLQSRVKKVPSLVLADFDLSDLVVGNGVAASRLSLDGHFADDQVTVLGITRGSKLATSGAAASAAWRTPELDGGTGDIGLSVPIQFIDSMSAAYLRTRAVPIRGVGRLLAAHGEISGGELHIVAKAVSGSGPQDTVLADFQWVGQDLALQNLKLESVGCDGGKSDACSTRTLAYQLALNTLKQYHVSVKTKLRPTKPTNLPIGSQRMERTYVLSVVNAHTAGTRLTFGTVVSAPRPKEGQ